MDDELGGCLVALLVIGVVFYAIAAAFMALIYGGQSVIIAIEFVANGFNLLGVAHPILAWALLGGCVGALVGLAQGLRKAGRKSDVPKAYWGVGAVVGILLLCSASTVDRTRRLSAQAAATAAVERASARLRVTNVAPCDGEYSTVNNSARCQPDKAKRTAGVRFDFVGAIPNETEVVVKWFMNGKLLRESNSVKLRNNTGWVWDNYKSSTASPLSPGTYETVLLGVRTERGRGQVVVVAQTPPKAAPSSVATPAFEREPPQRNATERIRYARELLERREYKPALSEAEEAIRAEPDNREALSLRDQIQGIIRVLNP